MSTPEVFGWIVPRLLWPLVFVGGCEWFYEDPPPPPRARCFTPDQWVERSCEEICQDGGTRCVAAPECGGMAVVGYKRLDACPALEYYTELPQSCEDPLPESLTESVYIVACCCEV